MTTERDKLLMQEAAAQIAVSMVQYGGDPLRWRCSLCLTRWAYSEPPQHLQKCLIARLEEASR
jgi:hypothetical protein